MTFAIPAIAAIGSAAFGYYSKLTDGKHDLNGSVVSPKTPQATGFESLPTFSGLRDHGAVVGPGAGDSIAGGIGQTVSRLGGDLVDGAKAATVNSLPLSGVLYEYKNNAIKPTKLGYAVLGLAGFWAVTKVLK